MPYEMTYIPEGVKKKSKGHRKRAAKETSDVINKEIKELQIKRAGVITEAKKNLIGLKGVKRFAVRTKYVMRVGSIDKAIKEREKYGKVKMQISKITQQTDLAKAQEKLREARDKARAAQKKNLMSQEDIFGEKDLFRIG